MSHFAFLDTEWPDLAAEAKKAESAACPDPRTACFYARRTLELAIDWMYRSDTRLKLPYQDHLAALLHAPEFRGVAGNGILTKAKLIKDTGNRAVHSSRSVQPHEAITAVRELFHFTYWLARTYARGRQPDPGLAFRPNDLPRDGAVPAKTLSQLQKLEEELAARDEKLTDLLGAKAALDEELQKLRADVAKARAKNDTRADTHDYNEEQTRDAFIDLLLKEAGWPLDQARDREFEVAGMPNNQGIGFVDYVLWGDDGKPLCLIEAKRTKRDAREGQQQAKLYADCLEAMFGQRPVIFYSNGYEHWVWDDAMYPPRQVSGFYKKDELQLLIQRRTSRAPLASAPIDEAIAGRFYQTRAIRKINEAFERDHERKALLVMATGTGKTRTVIALVDQLMKAGWVKRALFLADRKALVRQAARAFTTHLPSSAPVNLVEDKTTEGRIYVSTYPTMMGLIDDRKADAQYRFGPGHFDLIVIDEAHRSVYQKYRAIFDYFDSYLVGLTATPRDEIDRNTYSLFDLEEGLPTDAYSLDQAVSDGYLVPPKSVSVPLRFVREGIKYDDLSEEEKNEWDALEWSEDGDVPDEVGAAEINKFLFNEDTVDKVLETLMRDGVKVAGGDRIGKTIVFAKNHDHAIFIEKRFNKAYPHYKGHFARVIDFKTEYAQSLIEAFEKPESDPHIAISVDMLDTGIDVPDVVNLVFFKVVRSRTKFWQMIGRGTRLRPDLFAPGEDKQYFAVFDFCQNLEFFSANPDVAGAGTTESLSKRLFKSRVELIAALDAKKDGGTADGTEEQGKGSDGQIPGSESALRVAITSGLHDEVVGMNLDNFIVRRSRKQVEAFGNADAWNDLTDEKRQALIEHVAGLPSPTQEDKEEAKRFDFICLRLQLALLKDDAASFDRLRKQVIAIAEALEAQSAIPMIQAQLDLIQELQTDEYWKDITVVMLEAVRRRLRSLIHLIEQARKKVVYTNFRDEIGDGTEVTLPGTVAGMDFERFRKKAQSFLRAHSDRLALMKLRRNEQLTETDLSDLESILLEVGEDAGAYLPKVKEEGLVAFVRSLVGLDRDAIRTTFGAFISAHQLSAAQIEFMDLVIDHLSENGPLDPARLYDSPFTDIHQHGVGGLFPEADVISLIEIVESFHARQGKTG